MKSRIEKRTGRLTLFVVEESRCQFLAHLFLIDVLQLFLFSWFERRYFPCVSFFYSLEELSALEVVKEEENKRDRQVNGMMRGRCMCMCCSPGKMFIYSNRFRSESFPAAVYSISDSPYLLLCCLHCRLLPAGMLCVDIIRPEGERSQFILRSTSSLVPVP